MTPDKRTVLESYLRDGETHIVIDATQPGVCVPRERENDPQLILKISYRYEGRDLVIDTFGISCTLSFNHSSFYVRIPWAALFLVGRGDRFASWPRPEAPPLITKRRGTLGLVN